MEEEEEDDMVVEEDHLHVLTIVRYATCCDYVPSCMHCVDIAIM
jgi:hypothetical protein